MSSLRTHLVEVPIKGNEGEIWNCLHCEREDICEALLRESASAGWAEAIPEYERTALWHRELMQSRLRQIDDALDRIMAASYGHCSRCGGSIEETRLYLDPAIAVCADCAVPSGH